ncbi:MAG: hypothetical protein LBG50_01100, partial [Clostridiales Family XIII bacterium]|nr:hypothetical protein [Clostridiales Family XIII bacterium]
LTWSLTPHLPGPCQDLLLNYAMLADSYAYRFTWILLPVAGMDFQPQTRAASLTAHRPGLSQAVEQ